MPKYLLATFQDEVRSPMPQGEDVAKIYNQVAALQESMVEAGVWVFSGALTAADSATVVVAENDAMSMTDGPYAEAKEQIGGFSVIEVDHLDEALEWARRGSTACGGWPIEVRPFMDGPLS